jgi:hypothetical protein
MDPFIIAFFAALLIAWFIANQMDREEKRKRERAISRLRSETSGHEKAIPQVQQIETDPSNQSEVSSPGKQ